MNDHRKASKSPTLIVLRLKVMTVIVSQRRLLQNKALWANVSPSFGVKRSVVKQRSDIFGKPFCILLGSMGEAVSRGGKRLSGLPWWPPTLCVSDKEKSTLMKGNMCDGWGLKGNKSSRRLWEFYLPCAPSPKAFWILPIFLLQPRLHHRFGNCLYQKKKLLRRP